MSRRFVMLAAACAIACVFAALPAVAQLPDPAALSPRCDQLDGTRCLLPFPSDVFTVADATTATGRRVDFPLEAMPRNTFGKPIDPTEWNRNDGFSPGSALLTHVPGLDLHQTFGTAGRAERYRDQITDLSLSLAPDAPIVLLNATTGERHPYWAELDTHPGTTAAERLLIVRPAVNFAEATRYVVALRGLRDAAGGAIASGPVFSAYRDGTAGPATAVGFENRRPAMERIFGDLQAAGIARDGLYLAWDFTVASEDSLAGRALAIRDDAFAQLGDADLANGIVEGDAPAFAVGQTTTDGATRRIEGTVSVPNYLTLPQTLHRLDLPLPETDTAADDVPLQMPPGSRFFYDTPTPGPTDVPVQNPVAATIDVPFVCTVDATTAGVTPATPMLYGHGLLGSRNESTGSSTAAMRQRNFMVCAVDWIGMSGEDLANVATILVDGSNFGSLADRAQQGFLNFLILGRALVHPQGLGSHAAFQTDDGRPLLRTDALVYDGNSQGGIMGGALVALAPDLTRGVLGVPAINYSTLLNRSVDWEGAYSEISYAFYGSKIDQQLFFGLIQMLWDRAEGNGYAHHMTDDPLPNTPAHQVLLHVAWGDYQVANVAAEVEGRTVGACTIPHALEPGLHWSVNPSFGLPPLDDRCTSALVYWDSGNPAPPNGNVPPEALGQDPHGDPRRDPFAAEQKLRFFSTGEIIDVHPGEPYRTFRYPQRAAGSSRVITPPA